MESEVEKYTHQSLRTHSIHASSDPRSIWQNEMRCKIIQKMRPWEPAKSNYIYQIHSGKEIAMELRL